MHVVQLNLVPAPVAVTPTELPDRWPSLADIAEAAAAAGVRVSVVQSGTREVSFLRNGIDYHFLPLAARDGPRRLAVRLAALGADLAHVHGLDYARQAHALAVRLPWLPILLQDHANRPPPWWRRGRWRRWYAAASAVSFTSMDMARPFLDAGLFRAATALFAIPESSCCFTPGDREAARASTGLHGSPCVLWIGHLDANKDPLTVLEGAALAAQHLPDLQLWCAFANAPLLKVVQTRIDNDPRLTGRVHLLGRVPHAQVEAMLRAADMFVSGSRAESCGYAALEAIACGVPPVLTDIPAFRTLTADGRVGCLWPTGNAVRLADALAAITLLRPKQAELRAHFDATLSYRAVGQRWAQAYAYILAEHRRRTA